MKAPSTPTLYHANRATGSKRWWSTLRILGLSFHSVITDDIPAMPTHATCINTHQRYSRTNTEHMSLHFWCSALRQRLREVLSWRLARSYRPRPWAAPFDASAHQLSHLYTFRFTFSVKAARVRSSLWSQPCGHSCDIPNSPWTRESVVRHLVHLSRSIRIWSVAMIVTPALRPTSPWRWRSTYEGFAATQNPLMAFLTTQLQLECPRILLKA